MKQLHQISFLLIISLFAVLSEGRYFSKIVKPGISLDEYLNGAFAARSFNATWLSDTTLMYNQNGEVFKFDVVTKTGSKFIDASKLEAYDAASISISPDELYVLIKYNVISVFRHSTTAQYTIYDIKNDKYYDVHNKNHLQLVKFGTNQNLVYVFDNNIYYIPNIAQINNIVQVTTQGQPGVIYCGVPDWVYEEEVFGTGSALWLSPDSNYLAYAEFDDSNMKTFTYTMYGSPGELTDQYPTQIDIKYPKVGQKNPLVKIYVYDLSSHSSYEVKLFDTKEEFILFDLNWISTYDIAIIASNRVQNESQIFRCAPIFHSCILEDVYSESNGWLDPLIPKYSKTDITLRLEILPQTEGVDRFDHLVLTNSESGKQTRLTFGRREVTQIFFWDETNDLIYYGATVEDAPSQQQVYVVTSSGEDKCLTCSMKVNSEDCKYATASFSPIASYFAKICQGPGPEFVQIESTQNASDIFIWEDNKALVAKLAERSLPKIKDTRVAINGRYEAHVRMILPPGLDEASKKKYPAIVNVYAGPNSNQISDKYSAGLQNYLATTREYIYIFIDGRGRGRDGKRIMFETYRRLGTIEIEDQLNVTRDLQRLFPYIDAENTGIWGWSYGGFAAAWALAKDRSNIFKFGLSVAPVTSFIYYDSIYTERYMGLPTESDNLAGYNQTDLSRNVESFRGKNFFLIHGNADDNVHYQQSMVLSKALEQADIQFRQQSYPDENHSLAHVSRHLYHTIDQWWAEMFGVAPKANKSIKRA